MEEQGGVGPSLELLTTPDYGKAFITNPSVHKHYIIIF